MSRSSHGRGIVLAITAGVMAALASASAKLAMTADSVHQICSDIIYSTGGMGTETVLCDSVSEA